MNCRTVNKRTANISTKKRRIEGQVLSFSRVSSALEKVAVRVTKFIVAAYENNSNFVIDTQEDNLHFTSPNNSITLGLNLR